MATFLLNGVASAASYTVGAVPAILSGTVAVAGAAGNAVVGAVSSTGVGKYAGTAAKGVAGAAGGAVAASTAGLLTLKMVGFTALGPAAGSVAANWMSSIAVANGGGVVAGSLYASCQSAAMGGGVLLGGPVLAAGAVVGAATWAVSGRSRCVNENLLRINEGIGEQTREVDQGTTSECEIKLQSRL